MLVQVRRDFGLHSAYKRAARVARGLILASVSEQEAPVEEEQEQASIIIVSDFV